MCGEHINLLYYNNHFIIYVYPIALCYIYTVHITFKFTLYMSTNTQKKLVTTVINSTTFEENASKHIFHTTLSRFSFKWHPHSSLYSLSIIKILRTSSIHLCM